MPTRRAASFSVVECLTGVGRAVAAVFVAAIILAKFPLDPRSIDKLLLHDWGARTITIGIVFVVIYQLVNAALGTFSWRRLSRGEARVFLRSEVANWSQQNMRHAIVRQVRERRKRKA